MWIHLFPLYIYIILSSKTQIDSHVDIDFMNPTSSYTTTRDDILGVLYILHVVCVVRVSLALRCIVSVFNFGFFMTVAVLGTHHRFWKCFQGNIC